MRPYGGTLLHKLLLLTAPFSFFKSQALHNKRLYLAVSYAILKLNQNSQVRKEPCGMQPLLIILLLLSVLTNVLLILLLLRSGQQNTAEDHTDEISRIVRDEVEAETEVLADQLRVMQGEVTRTTSASARDMGTLLAESQRQSQEAATARLDAIAEENGITIEYEVTSGQGDQTVLRQLSDQAIADGVDAIIPIATTAAQVAAVSAEESKTPVIFAAISYPETVELTGMDYVTGTSDALDTNQILDMMFTQNPDIGSVGLLYSLSEPNSEVPIADAKAYLDAKGVAYTEATANTNDEVIAAASSLIADGVDAVFTPTDNIIMAAELAIYEDFIAAGIPHYTGADSFVRNGAFATCGVNYTDLGAETADLAYQAMTGGMDGLEDYYQVAGGLITVNSETAAALAIDPAVFESLGQVTTVTTTED